MAGTIVDNLYGKSRIRMLKVRRDGARHDVSDLVVSVGLQGDFDAAHRRGDNRNVLPTDTMKNTVYALGRDHGLDTIESFALDLARHFRAVPPVAGARVRVVASRWVRARIDGAPHPHTFMRCSPEVGTCAACVDERGERVESGLDELALLKTAGSGFEGFLRDGFTTLEDTDDRLLGTSVTAIWSYTSPGVDYAAARAAIREALIGSFGRHPSRSVQETLYAMGEAALDACPALGQIHISLPNRHNLLVDLSAFGLSNENTVFMPIDEPHGLIEATVRRER